MTIYEFGGVLAEKRFLRHRSRFARNLSLFLSRMRGVRQNQKALISLGEIIFSDSLKTAGVRSLKFQKGESLCAVKCDYWTVSGLLADFVLVTPKPGVRNPSVLEAARLVYEVRSLTCRWSAYGCLSLSAVERKRLLHRQTAFVVAGRQVFLPFFGIALRDDFGALAPLLFVPLRNCACSGWLRRQRVALRLFRMRGRSSALPNRGFGRLPSARAFWPPCTDNTVQSTLCTIG